jgi:DNA-binding IclR family transcriptional regulator
MNGQPRYLDFREMSNDGSEAATATGVKVVDKAIWVLDLFDEGHPEWGVSEIADRLALPMSTAHRIVHALETHAFLMRAGSQFRLGMAAIDLHRRATPEIIVPPEVRQSLQRLYRETGETAVLTVFDPRHHCARCVDRLEAAHSLRLSIAVGQLLPPNSGASSKAVIAYLDPEDLDLVLAAPLSQVGPRSITSVRKLRQELLAIRKEGQAFSYEETNVGTWGVSAPILARDGRFVAAIGIAAPTARYSEPARRKLSAAVRSAARRASKLVEKDREAPGVSTQAAR